MHIKKVSLVSLLAASLSCAALSIATADFPINAANAKAGKKTLKIKISKDVVLADQLMAKGQYATAGDLYRNAINNDPNCLPGYLGLGMALAKQFKLDGASQQLDKALKLDPGNPVALSAKGMVDFNRLQSSSVTIQKNRDNILKQAESEVKEGLTKDPGMPEAHYTLGMIYKEQGRFPEAQSEFEQATKLDPTYSEPFAGLGLLQLQQGDTASAITSLKQAVANQSGNSTAHYGLGKAYLKNGQVDDAINELNTSLGQFPNSAPARLSMGEAYAQQGNTVAAVQQFQESIRIKPENLDAYLHIADIRESRGDLEHSIAELRSAMELFPNSADLHLRVADESLKLEKLDDAMKEYRSILDQDPHNAAAAKGLTRACYLKANKEATGAFFVSNEFENASHYIDQAVSMNPNDMELRLAQAKLRSMAGAKVDLASVGTPHNDGERVAYAEALLAQNDFKNEDAQMQMVIANANDSKQAFAVGDLALMIKDLPNAEAAYRKAQSMPGGAERAKRGLDQVASAKDTARQDLTLANDLSRRKQLASAVDKYHASIYENPKVGDTRFGLAETLERLTPAQSKDLREAIVQYNSYLALTPNILPKDAEKVQKKIASLTKKADKLELKEKNARAK